jgi:L-lactate dehydrogenase (cytochrome)
MRAAASEGVVFMIPNLSSKSFDTILSARSPDQPPSWLQIYVNPSKEVVLAQIRACETQGVQALAITVDSAVPGKRERDQRNKIAVTLGAAKLAEAAASGTSARKPGNYANRDPGLNWEDIKWFQAQTKLPLIIKGVQCGEDAVLAAKLNCQAIILSNHGGRNLDTSRSGIEVLPEVVEALKAEGLFGKIEIYVDGGVRRGTDILKAIALGANAVGLGKPAVYSMSAYGEKGIVRMLQILKEELTQAMQLVGVSKLKVNYFTTFQ